MSSKCIVLVALFPVARDLNILCLIFQFLRSPLIA